MSNFNGELLLNRKRKPAIMPTFAIFLLLGVLVFFYFFAFIQIRGASMENSIFNQQYCLAQRTAYDVERGDIVIIDVADETGETHDIVKRVIATSGDRLLFMSDNMGYTVDLYLCKKGESYFKKLDEPYIKERMLTSAATFYTTPIMQYVENIEDYDIDDSKNEGSVLIYHNLITVPENSIFFLGDNRNISNDARKFGMQSLKKVKYKIISIVY